MAIWAIILASWLSWSEPTPAPASHATPSPVPTPEPPVFLPPETPALSPAGENLVIEFEVGGRSGYNPRPEAPDCRFSGITTGVGYDWSTNSPGAAFADWRESIGDTAAKRLAATHPYTGCKAKDHLAEVRDIITNWQAAIGVFDKIDVAREYARDKRAFVGFEDLRANAQAAIISLTFNRGASMIGDNRREMRTIRDLVPKQDYTGIANEFRKMIRIWSGTSIYQGMKRRRFAEADLVETP